MYVCEDGDIIHKESFDPRSTNITDLVETRLKEFFDYDEPLEYEVHQEKNECTMYMYREAYYILVSPMDVGFDEEEKLWS